MITAAFIAEHWVSLVFGFISTAAIAYCRFLYKKFQEYEVLRSEKEHEQTEELIESRIKPLQEALAESNRKFESIKESYKYRIIALCQIYLERGYLSTKEYDQLSEMWKVYHDGLHGNHQAEDYYYKTIKLPIHD